jgi:hypothetical protein
VYHILSSDKAQPNRSREGQKRTKIIVSKMQRRYFGNFTTAELKLEYVLSRYTYILYIPIKRIENFYVLSYI